jgi:hypothetical protein
MYHNENTHLQSSNAHLNLAHEVLLDAFKSAGAYEKALNSAARRYQDIESDKVSRPTDKSEQAPRLPSVENVSSIHFGQQYSHVDAATSSGVDALKQSSGKPRSSIKTETTETATQTEETEVILDPSLQLVHEQVAAYEMEIQR